MFIVVDITYNERMWEFNPFAFRARLLAMGITITTFFLGSFIYQRIARYFINKSKDKKKSKLERIRIGVSDKFYPLKYHTHVYSVLRKPE